MHIADLTHTPNNLNMKNSILSKAINTIAIIYLISYYLLLNHYVSHHIISIFQLCTGIVICLLSGMIVVNNVQQKEHIHTFTYVQFFTGLGVIVITLI